MSKITKSIVITTIGIAFLTFVGMAAASPNTTKSSPLYPLKMAIEAATLASASQQTKAIKQAAQIDQRLAELKILEAKINDLEKNQKIEQAAKLQSLVEDTKLQAKKSALEAKNNAKLIPDQSKRDEVIRKVEKTEDEIDSKTENEYENEQENEYEQEDKEMENENVESENED